MPAIPVREASNPCFEHECALCCYETEMPLTEADMARLEAQGHKREDFTELDEETNYLLLKNVPATLPREGHHCVFLVEDKCSVYEHRPEGCRWYPITVTPERRLTKDDECPHTSEFRSSPGAQRYLVQLLNEMEREARRRGRS